jgi:hypothetical protein
MQVMDATIERAANLQVSPERRSARWVRPSWFRLMSINLDVARHLRPHPSSTKGADEIGDLAALGRFV